MVDARTTPDMLINLSLTDDIKGRSKKNIQ